MLVDTGDGLALVDTGWGTQDCTNPSPRLKFFADAMGSPRDLNETATHQVAALGYAPEDVKHIFLTHMHLDHAGGLPDFPWAAIHLLAEELEACLHPRTLMERYAYIPGQYAHNPNWQPHRVQGDHWFGLACTPPVRVGEAAFILVPMIAHTRGHCAVALKMKENWLLHCGDAYGYHRQVDPAQPYVHPASRLGDFIITAGFKMSRTHRDNIRQLLDTRGDEIQVFCSHDAHEFESYLG